MKDDDSSCISKRNREPALDGFAYLINEMNNCGMLHPVALEQISYAMSKHNKDPWKVNNIKDIICLASQWVEERNLA